MGVTRLGWDVTVVTDSIVAGLKGDKSLTAKLESGDEETKAMLLDYVSNI